jgi:predicted nucleotidyltransferase component of viral defense system
MLLPALPEQDLLADLCKEAATRERVSPAAVEKDFYLTRLIWALAQRFEDRLLLKGGTLLSKVDLGFHRMSEDVDMVIPLEGRSYKPQNAKRMDRVRDVLREIAPEVGMTLQHPDGQRFDRHTHAVWNLEYPSTFGRQGVIVEVTMRPLLKPSRRSPLGQLLDDPLAGDYADAFCWALDAMEARAEKVRAAFTRSAGRDFYDLGLLVRKGVDLNSAQFLALVDEKLSELKTPPLSSFATPFDLQGERRRAVEASLAADLPAVIRFDEPSLDLDVLIDQFEQLWS